MSESKSQPTQPAMAAAREYVGQIAGLITSKGCAVDPVLMETDVLNLAYLIDRHFSALRAELAAAKATITGQVNQIANQSREIEALRADLAAKGEALKELTAVRSKEISDTLNYEWQHELVEAREALEQIFKWWDAHDGHLTTHFSSAVPKKMESFSSLSANAANKGEK